MNEFKLNQEELLTLKTIRDLNDSGKKAEYYEVVETMNGDTEKSIPIVARLDEDGYIKSGGLIERYCRITEKGRKTLEENHM